ncbi:MAG TPA: P27 family phage terminase small subunit [Gallicola sp.]|nr:P27 family phage terminase small subunit [Gallicola sp.]
MTKKQIIEYLKNKNIYDDCDVMLVDELIFNLQMIKNSKREIKDKGVLIDIARADADKEYWQQNPAIAIYNKSVKNLLDITRKLSLSPLDRSALKIDTEYMNEEDKEAEKYFK